MKRLAALCAVLICAACNTAQPALLPPPFGPDPANPESPRLFFPTGIVIAPDASGPNGWVVISNSNADRLYEAGVMYALRASTLTQFFEPTSPVPACTAQNPNQCNVPFPSSLVPPPQLGNAAITGNYTGPMVFGDAIPGDPNSSPPTPDTPATLYTGSRDTNRLNSVAIDEATGALTCRLVPRFAPTSPPDCRNASIDLNNAAQVEGPFGVVAAKIRVPGTQNYPNPAPAVLVASLVPRIDSIEGGQVLTSSHLVALDQANPASILLTTTITDRVNGPGVAGGPMIFDDVARDVIIAGCFTRFGSASAGGELSTLKCGTQVAGILRFVPVDNGSSTNAASTRIYDLSSQLRSTDTTGLALGGLDPATGARTLYMANRNPDTVARVSIPTDPAFGPLVQAVSTVSSQPSQILLLQRPTGSSGPDLLAVTGVATYGTSTAAGKLLLIDGSRGLLVGQVDDIGDTPFAIAQFPPAQGATSARLVITLFGSCSLSLIEVPFDQPGQAALRARIGSCPQ